MVSITSTKVTQTYFPAHSVLEFADRWQIFYLDKQQNRVTLRLQWPWGV